MSSNFKAYTEKEDLAHMYLHINISDDLGKEMLNLPGNHDIRLRQVTLSVIRIQDSGSQDHCGFHRHYSLRPAHTHTGTQNTTHSAKRTGGKMLGVKLAERH